MLARARGVPGVAEAEGNVFDVANIYAKDGDKLGARGAPNFVTSVQPSTLSPFSYVQGRAPRAAGEVALDRNAVDKGDYSLGDEVGVVGQQGKRLYTLVGVAKFGSQTSIAGATIAIMTLPEAQRVLGEAGRFDEIDVRAAPGVSPEALVPRLRAALPASVTVRTGEAQARSMSKDVREGFSFITTALLIFAGVVLFVGAFMIFNTFSITVAQRMREFALLRPVGASRGQVLRSVVLEALLVGLVASVAGLLLGIALAPGLKALFGCWAATSPGRAPCSPRGRSSSRSWSARCSPWCRASRRPCALRACRRSPRCARARSSPRACRPAAYPARLRRPGARRGLIALGLFGGAGGGSSAGLLGAGAAVVFIAVALLSKHVVRPLASAVGVPVERLRGVTGRLARENVTRNTGRTAATAAALMIGMALVTFVTILAAGIKDSVASSVDKGLTGAFVVQNEDGFSPIPTATAGALRRVPGIANWSRRASPTRRSGVSRAPAA